MIVNTDKTKIQNLDLSWFKFMDNLNSHSKNRITCACPCVEQIDEIKYLEIILVNKMT